MADKYNEFESAGLGALQGASLGFADEVEGAARSLKDVMGKDKNLSDLVDIYKQRRDEARQKYQDAQQQNPKSFMAGNVAGGLSTALIPGVGTLGASGALEAAGVGAATGGLAGLGNSNADNMADMAKDTATGAAIGGVAAPLMNKGFGKVQDLLANRPLPASPSAFAKTPEEFAAITGKIKDVEQNLPDLIQQAQLQKNTDLAQAAQKVRDMQPSEDSTQKINLEDLLGKMRANGQ